jgi:hypothetical protein
MAIVCLKRKRRPGRRRDFQKSQKTRLLVKLPIRLIPHDRSALPRRA